ncbi:SDR family NAD(P)-dependent oxidoreductase [Novosphingobium sp. 9]|uniref:SDR family NAD(P)-dependent oxidoreductase n=1 Tax=Novosphingobium sp. 9 TaxID=2025349 RepID=UPI0021B6BD3C|nr:SDR family NAD(P)-dependent oxidoreductase [Novosphingobium sp. 9]
MTRPAIMVTGGARRIGAAICRHFGANGWHIVIHCGYSRDEADALAAELESAEVVQFDLADQIASHQAMDTLADRLDDWRVLVNCAGVFELDDANALNTDIFDRAMRVNAEAPVLLGQTFLAHARTASTNKSQGRVLVQITDQKTANPNPDFFSYTLSKHALSGSVPMLDMMRPHAEDRVYALAPGAILASHDQSEAEAEQSHRLNLLKRRTDAQEIARTVAFLATGCLSGGQTVFVDSGQHLLRQPRDVLFLAREQSRAPSPTPHTPP